MNCGLPTFATNQGGPAEIIVDGVSGFHINPSDGEESSNKIADFFEKCKEDLTLWNKVSTAGLQRIDERSKQVPHSDSYVSKSFLSDQFFLSATHGKFMRIRC